MYALPCATQNELDLEGCKGSDCQRMLNSIAEGANMPTTLEATEVCS